MSNTNNTNLTETITTAQIRELRAEAIEAGDDVQVILCDIATGDEDPIATGVAWEERFGGGGFEGHQRVTIMGCTSAEVAREMCADAIRAASAVES